MFFYPFKIKNIAGIHQQTFNGNIQSAARFTDLSSTLFSRFCFLNTNFLYRSVRFITFFSFIYLFYYLFSLLYSIYLPFLLYLSLSPKIYKRSTFSLCLRGSFFGDGARASLRDGLRSSFSLLLDSHLQQFVVLPSFSLGLGNLRLLHRGSRSLSLQRQRSDDSLHFLRLGFLLSRG